MKVALDALSTLAHEVLTKLPQTGQRATIIALTGNLGAGKTTFVQGLGRELGIKESMQSPTYVLMKNYDISKNFVAPRFRKLVHIDAYRLNNAKEFDALKPANFLNDVHNLICIEWPERVEGALPKPDIVIKFSSENTNDKERFIEIK